MKELRKKLWIILAMFGLTFVYGCGGSGCGDKGASISLPLEASTALTAYAFTTPAKYREMVNVRGAVITGGKFNRRDKGAFPSHRKKVKLSSYEIAKYETTWELWDEVATWANDNGYTFISDSGYQGHEPASVSGQKAIKYGEASGTSTDAWTDEERKSRPVSYVSWYDAVVWCNAYSEMDGRNPVYLTAANGKVVKDATDTTINSAYMDAAKNGYRLPTGAEWEFAARGGDTSAVDWHYLYAGQAGNIGYATNSVNPGKTVLNGTGHPTDGPYQVAWWRYNAYEINGIFVLLGDIYPLDRGAHPVGTKAANRLGLYDMSGNVCEWCWDRDNDYVASNDAAYTVSGVVVNPRGDANGLFREHRGGSWEDDSLFACVATRYSADPGARANKRGFRVVRATE